MAEMKEPKKTVGQLNKLNGVLGPGMMAFDMYSRVKDGENPAVAAGKAIATDMMWRLIPGGPVAGLALMAGYQAIQLAPAIGQAIENRRNQLSAKMNNFASANYFKETEVQQAMLQQGFNQIQTARQQAVRVVANHARNAQRVY